ncbi:MAG TPA: condensation domain-containing protein, partial [Isosphaeraceae bacterium]|nr:condensation domain-containing protein [Isosphaeraceae bacterium]
AFYNIPIAVRLAGALDADALVRSFNEIIRRHEVLRTTFAAVDGRPVQVVSPTLEIAMPVEDLSDVPEAQREAEVERLVREESARPFDLARGPLIRAGLIRLAESEHVALVNMHHIISDGWSIGVLVREVGAIYDAFASGHPSPLPEPPLQYVDYAVWQREWLQGDVLQAQLDYWKDTLGGVPSLELPADRPRPAVLGHRGGELRLALPKELVEGLRALGKKEGVTPFMTLLAAFQALLHRYSGQDDFAIGTPIAGRTRPEVEDLIGFFVNTLVLRGDLKGDPSFRALLGRVKRSALSAYAHQDLPFEQLVGVLHPDRDPSRSPLFQVMFALQNAPLPALESPGLTMTPLPTESGTAKFDLTMYVTESDEGLGLALEYNTDLFDPATIERMLGHFRTLLEGIVADPDQTVAMLPMLSEAERRRMLGQSGDPDEDEAGTDLDGLSDEELDALMTDLLPEEGPTDEQ